MILCKQKEGTTNSETYGQSMPSSNVFLAYHITLQSTYKYSTTCLRLLNRIKIRVSLFVLLCTVSLCLRSAQCTLIEEPPFSNYLLNLPAFSYSRSIYSRYTCMYIHPPFFYSFYFILSYPTVTSQSKPIKFIIIRRSFLNVC